jgi:hypothetical protein
MGLGFANFGSLINLCFSLINNLHGLHHVLGVTGSGNGLTDGIGAEGTGLANKVTDKILVRIEDSPEDLFVKDLGSMELGSEEPDEEAEADPVEVGDEVEDESEEGFQNVEETEDHPVGEPDLVVIFFLRLNGADGV